MTHSRHGKQKIVKMPTISPTILGMVVVAIAIFGSACLAGDSDSEGTFSKINADQTFRDLSSFEKAPCKLAKEYDISALPMANAAYMGYFTPPDSEPIQYELRIYPDHVSAVEKGIEYAEEVTGAEALLRSSDVRWDEGTKDRRGGGAFRGRLTPLYGDYAVIGNVIMLCEGRDSTQSLNQCEALLLAVGIEK
ncbi:MAG: hypothetical protein NZ807_12875 [Dehalococcoidia bacterium]|nr:hypothetical protein [Dehalococcoidia bacterium]